jgi:hypothetical protein
MLQFQNVLAPDAVELAGAADDPHGVPIRPRIGPRSRRAAGVGPNAALPVPQAGRTL